MMKKNNNPEPVVRHKKKKSSGKDYIVGSKTEYIPLSVGAVLLLVSFIPALSEFSKDILRMICTVLCSYPMVIDTFYGFKEKKFKDSSLMVIAVIAAMLIGEYFEAAAVSLLFRIGEMLEDYAGERSKKSIKSLYSLVSETGHIVREDGGFEIIDADDITVGMKLAVLPHEVVPVDGTVCEGSGTVDTSSLTGESIPVFVGVGDKIVGGTLNGSTALIYEASAVKAQSGAERIIAMVKEATENKGKSQRFIEKFVKYYTPAVIIIALLIAVIPSIITRDPKTWIYRALVILMSSCPCAIVISVPLAFLSSMGACAKNGMIVKGAGFIETAAAADTVVFDKTGTLTTDKPVVGEVFAATGYSKEQVLSLAGRCEYYSTHPLAKAIVGASGETDAGGIENFREISGGGVGADLPEGEVICGSEKFLKLSGIECKDLPDMPVYVVLNGSVIGGIEIINEIRATARPAIKALRDAGIKKLVMLTGDEKTKAERVGRDIGFDEIKSELLPEDKMTALEKLKSGQSKVIYVGDGINDAPALALADVGVAMGLGTQSACEAADVILTDSNLLRLPDTVNQSKRTVKIMKMNIFISVVVKAAVILLGAVGIAPIWLAVFADVGIMIVCVLNSARLLKIRNTLIK